MDFFNAQQKAHRSTKTLLLLFTLAVICLTLGLFGLVSLFLAFTDIGDGWSSAAVLAVTTVVTLSIVGGGSAYKVRQLRGGGATVCRMLGAEPVPLTAPDEETRRLRNIVEEMAVAAGLPVPELFVLDREPGINAFAAGFTARDAAICITRGCLEQLDRDELQGVIAHEFSHVLNGDMRLNIRLLAVLHGIICVSLAGYLLLRHGQLGGARRGPGMAVLGLGLGLVALGSIGALFARLIKAAVSRQREYLADASAVQFTRNPKGIRDALKKIGGYEVSSRVCAVHARAVSHMFFANAVFGRMADWFATHPPIEERIRAIDAAASLRRREDAATRTPAATGTSAKTGGAAIAGLHAGSSVRELSPGAALESVGRVTAEHVEFGRRLFDELPLDVTVALGHAFSARAVIYGLLLDEDREVRRAQFQSLSQTADPATVRETLALSASIARLDRRMYLPLVDLAIAALRTMSLNQARTFRESVQNLIVADGRVSLFEFAIAKILDHHLDTIYFGPAAVPVRFRSIHAVLDDCRRVLSVFAQHGHDRGLAAHRAFDDGAAVLDAGPLKPMADDECAHVELDKSLERLAHAAPNVKRTALAAFARAVASDGTLTPTEAELLRAVSDAIDCPMPPVPFAPDPIASGPDAGIATTTDAAAADPRAAHPGAVHPGAVHPGAALPITADTVGDRPGAGDPTDA